MGEMKMAGGLRKTAGDAGAMAMNVLSSVIIVMVNKSLVGEAGYGFRFVVTLTGLHFVASSSAMYFVRSLGFIGESKQVPFRDMAFFVVINATCIASLNLSLMVNTVGFYQIAKLLNIPCVCVIEFFWLGKRFSYPILASITAVLMGVGTVTVVDMTVRPVGLIVAMISVLATCTMQTMCRSLQLKYEVTSFELLLKSGMPTGLLLLSLGPFLDKAITSTWVHSYIFSHPAIVLIAASCLVAIFVNLSAFICLGRFSAVSFQVMGHLKTFMILTGGVMLFGDIFTEKQLLGMLLALAGMIAYSYYNIKAPADTPPSNQEEKAEWKKVSKIEDAEAHPLLQAEPDAKVAEDKSSKQDS